jgi:hypothetical protein
MREVAPEDSYKIILLLWCNCSLEEGFSRENCSGGFRFSTGEGNFPESHLSGFCSGIGWIQNFCFCFLFIFNSVTHLLRSCA